MKQGVKFTSPYCVSDSACVDKLYLSSGVLLMMKSHSKSLMKCFISETFSSGPALHYNILLHIYFPSTLFWAVGFTINQIITYT